MCVSMKLYFCILCRLVFKSGIFTRKITVVFLKESSQLRQDRATKRNYPPHIGGISTEMNRDSFLHCLGIF